MYPQSLLFFVLCTLRVIRADFIVVTNYPSPTTTTTLNEHDYNSFYSDAVNRFTSWEASQGSTYSSFTKAVQSELVEFAQTATYSVPAGVTDTLEFELYTTAPEWYSALPSDVRKQKEEQASALVSAVKAEVSDLNGESGVSTSFDLSTIAIAAAAFTFGFAVVLL
ncbi:hypothetical protein K491DRAFT_712140 [Lophiostoma macrostomum CBS 122681]|uniref:Uncharacterized protein n=1 Tax=Lophiostoma macrostomum CBS 122681 TaxID=1314788 RepID=A0A6A6TND5_9PLEO|nr:hypothetical protein K491DRAFT_712140 [Lophiostoma macrostomum CBS 122681]